MSISMGPFITCFLGIAFLSGYLYMILYRLNQPFIYGAKFVFVGIAIIFLRMCVPVNFPFTYTIYSRKLLPLAKIFYAHIGNSSYKVSDFLTLCWLIVAIMKLIRLCIRATRLHNYLDAYTVTEKKQHPRLFASVGKYCQKPVRIAVVPYNISPAISGILHPAIMFPESYDHFSEEELDYICMHEINHYENHDLWVKMLLDMVSCIHWWNPFVYLMKREYALALELTNDYLLMKEHTDFDHIKYAELIIKIAGLGNTPLLENSEVVPFARKKNSELNIRLSFSLKGAQKSQKKKRGLFIHTMMIYTVMFLSLLVVSEPTSRTSPITEDGTFEMNPENTYFVSTADGYEIYVTGIYVGTIDEIPEDFTNYKIYYKGGPSNEH